MTTILFIRKLKQIGETGIHMRYLILLALLASMPLHAGAIKKWVDEEGNVHYGDAPPVSAKTQDVRVQAPPSNPGKALPRLGTSGSGSGSGGASGDSAGGTTQAAAGSDDVPEDQAKAACDAAQEDIRIISSSSRVKLRMADGSTRYMTTEEIEERKAQAEADVERFCQ